MRRNKRGMRQQWLPDPADLDEVIAVSAITMKEHDKLSRSSGVRRKPRTIELSGQEGGAIPIELARRVFKELDYEK